MRRASFHWGAGGDWWGPGQQQLGAPALCRGPGSPSALPRLRLGPPREGPRATFMRRGRVLRKERGRMPEQPPDASLLGSRGLSLGLSSPLDLTGGCADS